MDFKAQIQKLEGASNWSKWRRQTELLLRHHEVLEIARGDMVVPTKPGQGATEEQKRAFESELKNFNKSDALAQLILVSNLNDANVDLTASCDTAKAIWDKLFSVYEQSSGQRLDRLMESFFSSEKDPSEEIAAHVARLERNFRELNDELKKLVNTELPDLLLMSRIMSTLPSEYFEFKSVWESVPLADRTVNKLTERLRLIEMRLPERRSESSALVATKKPTNGKFDKNKRKCFKCHREGHIARNCPTKKTESVPSSAGSSKREVAPSGEAFVSIEGVTDTEQWLADSGASAHMTHNKDYFLTYEIFEIPREVQIGNGEMIHAYGQGTINVEMKVNGTWQKNHLQNVWYVPKIGRNLFSIGKTMDKGFEFKANRDSCIFVKNGTVRLVGKRTPRGLYILKLRACKPECSAEVFVASATETLQLWHERLCHQNKRHVQQFLKQRGISATAEEEFCDGCMLGKQHRGSFRSRANRPVAPGEQISADVCGPMQEVSPGGARYFLCFKDDYTKFRRVFLLKSKNEVSECLKTFLNEAKTAGHSIKELLSDGGKEFDNLTVSEILKSNGINFRVSMPYTPEQNGAAERENRTLVECARSMIHAKDLPIKLWAEAVNTAVYVLNRTGPTSVEGKSPSELWHGKSGMTFSHMRIFGTKCFVHVPKQKRQKWDKKGVAGRFVGYCGDKDGYRVWIEEQNKVILSRDVIFKDETPLKKRLHMPLVKEEEEEEPQMLSLRKVSVSEKRDALNKTVAVEGAVASEEAVTLEENAAVGTTAVPDEAVSTSSSDEADDHVEARIGRRRNIKKPSYLRDYVFFAECSTPSSYGAAMQSSEADKWKIAMKEELASLMENNTWELVEPPPNQKVIGCRWVLRVKFDADGSVNRYKARLVAKGFAQKAGQDYEETFSPVVRFDTVRTVLSVAASEGLQLMQFDVKTAFLYGILHEEVYMSQPEGFSDGSSRVCKLNRSLYGLKQAPRCWNKRFVDFLSKLQFNQSEADPCLFIKRTETSKFGAMNCFVGMQIVRLENNSIFIGQSAYIRRILEHFRMDESNTVGTPAEKGTADQEHDSLLEAEVPYRKAMGSLVYLAVATRPDTAYAVSKVSEALANPKTSNWKEVKR